MVLEPVAHTEDTPVVYVGRDLDPRAHELDTEGDIETTHPSLFFPRECGDGG